MTIERPMFPPRGSSRRGFLSVVAGSTVAAVAPAISARAADSLGASQDMHAVADVLVDALLRLILGQAANDHAETVSTTWEAENPMLTSKRGRRRWLKRLDAHRETFIPVAWQALMQAEADFTKAQTALAAVPIAGMGDLRIMIAAAELYEGIELCRINRAPIARAVVAYFARTAEGGAVMRTNNKAPGLWIVAGTDGMAYNSAVETGAEGKERA
jgi:hypothetical protein